MFKQLVTLALQEDLGSVGDLSAALLTNHTHVKATVIVREPGVLCGTTFFDEVFAQVDDTVTITWNFADGDTLQANDILCYITGKAAAILTAERSALNFLQMLSGTATLTRHYVQLIAHTTTKLLDTRKTIPGFRAAQKYAVKCGGGANHRMGLYDAVLIKENHILAAGSIAAAVGKAKQKFPGTFIEVEVESLQELEQAMEVQPQRIMLDNFSLADLKTAVNLNQNRIPLEASGNINEKTLIAVAETGVDYISMGLLTKQINPLDLSLRLA